jgi:hypothetical protein
MRRYGCSAETTYRAAHVPRTTHDDERRPDGIQHERLAYGIVFSPEWLAMLGDNYNATGVLRWAYRMADGNAAIARGELPWSRAVFTPPQRSLVDGAWETCSTECRCGRSGPDYVDNGVSLVAKRHQSEVRR